LSQVCAKIKSPNVKYSLPQTLGSKR